MQVSRSSWHAKVYRWWYVRKFQHEPSPYKNLCPYMRVVLLWAWMRWLFIDGRIGKLRVPIVGWLALAVELPRWAGMINYELKVVLLIVYSIFVGVAAAVGVGYLITQYFKQRPLHVPLPKFTDVREFAKLVKAYSEAAHSRVCPELHLVDERMLNE